MRAALRTGILAVGVLLAGCANDSPHQPLHGLVTIDGEPEPGVIVEIIGQDADGNERSRDFRGILPVDVDALWTAWTEWRSNSTTNCPRPMAQP